MALSTAAVAPVLIIATDASAPAVQPLLALNLASASSVMKRMYIDFDSAPAEADRACGRLVVPGGLAGDAQRTLAVGAADDEPGGHDRREDKHAARLGDELARRRIRAYSCASAASTAASTFCRFWAGVSAGGLDVVEQPVIEPTQERQRKRERRAWYSLRSFFGRDDSPHTNR